jgi:nitrous oxide reductase accessory protein NosL
MYTRREAIRTVGKFVLVASTLNITDLVAQEMDFRVVPAKDAQILQEGKAKMFCPVCGMTLPMFYKTNHAADVKGKTHQYCSIHCMHEEAMLNAEPIANPQVVDNDTLKFIPAASAFYVVGSNKPGTMATISKYAFAKEQSAQEFAKDFGGEVMGYEQVSKVVSEGLKADIVMIKKRQAKAAKMGEKIYQKVCKQTPERFTSVADAKVYLQESGICGNLKGKEFQQVGLFLAGKGAI